MQGVLIKDDEWKDGLGVKLFNLQQTGQFCDVIIKTIEDARLLVHSCILAAASPLLRGVIESALSDSSLGTIMLSSDIDLATWNHMLEFMYMGSTSVEVTLLPNLSNGASILKIDTLVNKCSEVVIEKPATIEEQEPITEPPPESAETELYPAIAQIKEDSDHGMDTEDYNIDVQEIIAVDLNAKCPATPRAAIISATPSFEETTWTEPESIPPKPLISNDEKESPMLCGKDVSVQSPGTHLMGQFYEKTDIVVRGIRYEILESIESKGRRTYKCCSCSMEVSSPITHALVHTEERPYKCEYSGCFKSYKGKEALKRHIGSNHTPGSHHCPKCEKIYKTQHLLQKHLAVVCQNEHRPYVCDICHKPFKTRNSLTYHMGIHSSEKKFVCDICEKKFASKLHLHNHLLTHKTGCYKCFCGLQYKNVKSYKEHVKLIHDKNNPRRCPVCSRNFKNDQAFENHKRSHLKPFCCKVCKKGFNTASNCYMHEKLRHSTSQKSSAICGEWSCPTCGKICKTYRALYAHMRIHNVSDENKFECHICHLRFSEKQTLTDHFQSHSNTYWGCKKCQKRFPTQSALKYHEKHHYKLYACKFCGSRFSLAGYLKNHQRKCKHFKIENTTFTCPVCELKFCEESELESHISVKHPDEILINIQCNPEQTMLTRRSSSDVNGLFNCEVCTYVCQTEKSLLRHELKMHSLKSLRLSCTECSVKFTTSRTLNKHKFFEHNIGIKKKCLYCWREFYSSDDLTNHVWAVHKNDTGKEVQPSGVEFPEAERKSEKYVGSNMPTEESKDTQNEQSHKFKSLLSTFTKF